MNERRNSLVLLTGATGYIGGRLLDALQRCGARVRCMSRHPQVLESRVPPAIEVVGGDVEDPGSLRAALDGVRTAYYLVHGMQERDDFVRRDREAAANFASSARVAGVRRIIYLGGLGHGEELSKHLASRQEVGRVLAEAGVPVIELRASIVIGSGSLSFEMVRALVERLPVMITPRWVGTRAQPIGIEDVVAYLLAALDASDDVAGIFEIGGADACSYLDLMREYARQRGLRRWVFPVPVLTPWLSSQWLRLITPLLARVGRALIEGVRNETVVEDARALEVFDVRPVGVAEAIARALRNEDREFAETRWCDALGGEGAQRPQRYAPRIIDSRVEQVPCAPEQAFEPIQRIGGETGWYYADSLWRVRGFIDLLIGGPGLRRKRRAARALRAGDALDFWRVEAFEPRSLLRLMAEMRLPGRAWLQFEVEANGSGAQIRQTAIFDPLGLAGLAYWYLLYPLHTLIFRGMLHNIARAAIEMPMDHPSPSREKDSN